LVVVSEETVKVVPVVQVPEALPSSAGAGRSAKSCRERLPAGREMPAPNGGDQRYMLEPAGRVKELLPWIIASQTIPQYCVDVPNAQD
jgi:hypothetical protein